MPALLLPRFGEAGMMEIPGIAELFEAEPPVVAPPVVPNREGRL